MDYTYQIAKMIDEIRAMRNIVLIYCEINPPTEVPNDIDLPPLLSNFYRQCNGIKLKWIEKGHKHFNPKLHAENFNYLKEPFRRSQFQYGPGTGCINIPSLDEFLNTNWEGFLFWEDDDKMRGFMDNVCDEEVDSDAFMRNLKPFDWFSETKAVSLMNINNVRLKGKLVCSENSFRNYDNSKTIEIDEYLQGLFANHARLDYRNRFL